MHSGLLVSCYHHCLPQIMTAILNCGSFDPKDDELVTDTSGVLVSVAGEGVA